MNSATVSGVATTPERRQIDWFRNKLQDRYLWSAAAQLLPSVVAFFCSAFVLQVNPLHPLTTLAAIASVLTSWRTWVAGLFQLMLSMVTFVIAYNLVDVKRALSHQERRRVIYLSMLAGYVMAANSIITVYLLDIADSVYWRDDQPSIIGSPFLTLIFTSVLIASLKSVLSSTYQFSFPTVEQSRAKRCLSLCRISRDGVLFDVLLETLSSIKWTIGVLVLFVFPYLFYGAESGPSFANALWSLVSVRALLTAFVASYRVVLVQRFSVELINIYVMRPITFSTPPAYQVIGAPIDSHYLHTALNSTHSMLKYFAFWDLRRLSIGSRPRRVEVFTLSQPGGHPRNWQEVSQSCLAVLNLFQDKLHGENNQLGLQSSRAVDSTNRVSAVADRSALLVPTHLQNTKNARDKIPVTRNWHFDQHGLISDEPAKRGFYSTWQVRLFKLLHIGTEKPRFESPFVDAYLVVWSLEALSLLVFYSYDEDAFGIVHKDLSTILSCLLQLYAVLERNMRLKQMRAGQQTTPEVVVAVEQALTAALNRILSRFGAHIASLDLPADQRALLSSLSRT